MATPTLRNLFNSIITDLEQSTGLTGIFGKTVIRGFASVQAAKLKLVYLAVSKVQKNIFVDTADSEIDGGTLERFGRVKIERNPFPATQGLYVVTITGTVGFTVAAGSTLRNQNNDVYVVDNTVELLATTGVIDIRSVLGGTQFALIPGDVISFTAPIIGIENDAVVLSETEAPIDAEDIEVYRQAVLQAYVLEPQGGAASDYRIWATDAQGVKQVYAYAGAEPGIINIFIESTTGDGVPTDELVDQVQAVIEFDPDTTKPLNERGRKPISAWTINYLKVTPQQIEITIEGLNQENTEIENLITSAVTEYLDTIRPFVAGADDPNNVNDTLRTTGLISVIDAIIGTGNFFTSVTFTVDGNDETSFQFEDGNIPSLSDIIINP